MPSVEMLSHVQWISELTNAVKSLHFPPLEWHNHTSFIMTDPPMCPCLPLCSVDCLQKVLSLLACCGLSLSVSLLSHWLPRFLLALIRPSHAARSWVMKVANYRVVFFFCWSCRDSRHIAWTPRHRPCLILSCLSCPRAGVLLFPSLSFASTERRRPAPIALPTQSLGSLLCWRVVPCCCAVAGFAPRSACRGPNSAAVAPSPTMP